MFVSLLMGMDVVQPPTEWEKKSTWQILQSLSYKSLRKKQEFLSPGQQTSRCKEEVIITERVKSVKKLWNCDPGENQRKGQRDSGVFESITLGKLQTRLLNSHFYRHF